MPDPTPHTPAVAIGPDGASDDTTVHDATPTDASTSGAAISGDGDATTRHGTAPDGRGRWLEVVSWLGTVGHAGLGAAAVVYEPLRFAHLIVAGVLFFAGTVAMLVAFGFAVVRSTSEAIGMGGLYFLAGGPPHRTAPVRTARSFRAAFFVQVIVAVALAVAAPFTSLAFATLVPIWSLGLMGVWGGRFGQFQPRGSGNGSTAPRTLDERTSPDQTQAVPGARESRVSDNSGKR